jgi:membrane protease YdiL (CAAX protease family)
MQTTFEELVFRGIFLRWACKNKLGFTKKAMIAAVVSSVVFALFHTPNPEVTSQSGFDIFIAILTYFVPGFIMFIVDLYFGNMLPGIIIHFINNFLLFTVVSSDGNVVPVPTLLVDKTPNNVWWNLGSTFIAYIPVLMYILVDFIIKRKKAASAQ